ncbi:class I SAM-dependent methyltransferase [Cohnella terricola]|uniref:Class I SAM-dependent methyltransferase n=1 Tax=Cohnella terricola TaxID=1289167 RepID=A0A559JKP1_9BACL|nr:class I SAM-dependent methyltransferase [Cohnella terricola]TVY00451.1 class I SAM-dependent methyltransferase [Cohnella terricola]
MENKFVAPAYPQTGVASTCRSFDEYRAMFRLEDEILRRGPVLDVAGGASSFTAQLDAMGIPAVAVDPFYDGLSEQVIADGYKEIEVSSAKIAAMANSYDWSFYGSPENHRRIRESSMDLFAEHFRNETTRSRYYAASLPNLPFEDDTFQLAVCSHFLFLYSDAFDKRFHAAAIAELLRVLRPGGELRIYPLITLKWEEPSFLNELLEELKGVAQVEFLTSYLPFTPAKSPLLRLEKSI